MSRAFMEACDPVIRKEAAFTPIIRMAVLFGFAGTMVVGGVLVGAGALTTGSYAFMILLTQRFLWPLTNLGHSITNYQRSMASVNRVLGLLEAPVGPPSGDMPLDPGQVRGDIEFRRVDFSYRASRPVLEGFSLRLPAGRTTAIVGVTGAGKTTIAKLLLRFYDHGGGQILIDGEDIRRLRTRDLRGAIGLVSQDVFLFDGTILENIAYGRPDATMEEIVEAARIAELHAFVEQLPDGYRTVVGERGVKLSGGQRQRICIARAVLKDPPILVLDEATSSVDNETEAAIQRSLDRISKERTTLIIAHRLSTVRNADAIHVLGDRGRIVEEGRHDELIAQDGVYAALWRVQTGEA
jgi:ATP-binding cassette subfamily B protein